MALPNIVTNTDLQEEFPNVDAEDVALLERLRDSVEAMVREYVGHDIVQPDTEYVEYHPRRSPLPSWHGSAEAYDVSGDKAVVTSTRWPDNVLVLGQKFVRTITAVWEDRSAQFGKGSNDFSDSTLLVEGTDYVLDQVAANLSTTGRLIRIGTSWPSRPGTVKVQYVAGLTADELNAQYRFIKLAVLDEIEVRYRARKDLTSRSGPGGGIVEAFSIRSDFAERYETSLLTDAYRNKLLPSTRRKLQSIRHRIVWI